MLKIVQAPNTVLSHKAKEVPVIDKAIKHLLQEMEASLDAASDPEGVGLAAPQVDKGLRIFIVRQTPKSPLLTFINPKIEKFFDETEEKKSTLKGGKKRSVQLEGCLSLKDIWGVVKRHHGVELSYQDETGTKHTKKFEGFLATIIQHECDHLDGVLFPKRVLEQKNRLYHSYKNSKGETEFEEMSI
jgi:peptide deformylase